ncbi:MAG: hypothetical protein IJ727_12935 [Treponema sp.]|jgi:hypothetical protein|nr:hypothetical protein [Treponema sp.]
MAKANEEEFEISDEIVEKEEESTEQQKDDIFYAIILGKQITKTIHTSRGDFVVKFPKEKDRTAIDLLEASRRGGVPVESFTPAANSRLNEIATLDIVVIDGADWYKAAKQRNKNFSWGDMPDTEFVDSLFVEAWTFFQKVQSMFSDNKESENTEKAHKKDISETVGGGLFSGSATTGKRD